ncbi:MAG TPA: FAD:protein FMN transferase, partial [Candidatus Hydrogenedentes bacterium]|nr:FAD:protein FMN transferase [Candidatus Hydrogenedentota bacterium]
MSTKRSDTGKTVRRLGAAVLAAAAVTVAAGGWAADADPPAVHMTHRAMGAEFDFVLVGDSPQTTPDQLTYAGEAAFEAIDRLERRISNWIEESPVSVMNRRASEGPVVVDPDLFGLMETSRRFYTDTDGVFDVTVGPLLALWGFYQKEGVLPTPEQLAAARESVGMNRVELDPATRAVRFTRPGMRVDFGGIGKGLALDRAAEILRQNGVSRARLHSSTSTIVVMGTPPAAKT